jgi:pyruvate/2-oxoacid:ferredoxin oxidoreductase alpha subunit
MAERILMKGNEAIAEAAIRAGCRHFFGYPITPQTEVSAYLAKRMPKVGDAFCRRKVKSPPSTWCWEPPLPAYE